MTDKELLEYAAKAAGIEVRWHEQWKCFVHVSPFNTDNPPTLAGQRLVWVPLTDDGDALRLAVKLGLVVDAGAHKAGDGMGTWYAQVGDRDHNAATRRAIVRAAAEIGNAATTKTKAAREISLTSRQE